MPLGQRYFKISITTKSKHCLQVTLFYPKSQTPSHSMHDGAHLLPGHVSPRAEADNSDSGELVLEDSKITLGEVDPSRRGIIDGHQRNKGEHQYPHQVSHHGSSCIHRWRSRLCQRLHGSSLRQGERPCRQCDSSSCNLV